MEETPIYASVEKDLDITVDEIPAAPAPTTTRPATPLPPSTGRRD